MKFKKEHFIGIIVVIIIAAAVFGVYRWDKSKSHRLLAKRIAELSPRGGLPETFEGLQKAIAAYEDQIELNIKDGVKTATYWKILATRYVDRGMHNEALKALERAIYYNGEDATLFYLTGLSAAIVAKSSLNFPDAGAGAQERYFALAEQSYLRAIELDSEYPKPHYGLGILYSFELERPAEAVSHLERYMELMPRDINAMFALARAYYVAGNNGGAVELYDRIVRQAKDKDRKAEAQQNKEYILGLTDG